MRHQLRFGFAGVFVLLQKAHKPDGLRNFRVAVGQSEAMRSALLGICHGFHVKR